MRFGVLGPLEVSGKDGPLSLGGPKQRTVLAHLVLNANKVVPADRLIDALWGEEPPDAARGTLQAYVSRLRGVVGSEVLEGRAPGYVLRAEPEEVDALRFERLVGEARRSPVEPRSAVTTLAEALGLWRGTALADLAGEPSLAGEIARLEELRLQAVEEKIAAELELGRHAQAVAELETLTRTHPLRERLWGELMLALYRLYRQADALGAFERARQLLADELGIDPSRALQELHERILRQDPSLEVRGEPLRGYRLLEQVGEGAFGLVYRALQPQVGREVAIKAVHPELANHPDFVRRFEREAQIVARLEHPHIVPLYDYWREPDAAYLVMRFLRGGSLEELLEAGPLEPARAASILDQVASALAAAHRQGVVHRDVKPGNVLLDEEGNAYLTDFGVALDAGSPEKATGTMMRGHPAYLSPEQIRLEPATPRSDVYALGILAYEAFTGRHPFPDSSLSALLDHRLRDSLPSVRQARPDLSPAIDVAISRATARNAPDRFADVLELAASLRVALEGTAPAVRVPIEVRNPYKGLRPFIEADAGDFFGRERLTDRLTQRLLESGDEARFLAVVGPSGSGKSSVVRAGLVPALRRGAVPGSDRWYVIDIEPGPNPLLEIERALLGIAVEPPPSLIDELERDELGLVRSTARILPAADAELVIVIDQLEELFTLVDDEHERAHVLALIRAAALEPGSRVRVVATLRADFFDEPLMVPGFGDLLAARTEAITPMSLEEVERAIVAPADRAGLVVEPSLLAAIIGDVGGRPGTLLLQYALTELAEHHDGGVLRLRVYRRFGGTFGALARRAERIFDGLNEPARDASRQLLLRLVNLGEGVEDTRRRVRRSELDVLADAPTMEGVIEAFGRHRLLSFDRDPTTREPTVELAHEALLSAWDRLRGWIDEARSDLRTRDSLARSAAEWNVADRNESFLLRGARLEQTAEWAQGTSIALSALDGEYLRQSLRRRDEEAAAEDVRRRQERKLERRSARRLRGLVAVLAAAVIVASTLTVIAVGQRREASDQSLVAFARELAAASVANLDVDPERSILLALEAIETTRARDGSVLPEAEEALHRAVTASRIVRTFRGVGGILDWSPDGSLFVTEGEDESGLIDIRDARTGGSVIPPFPGHEPDVNGVVFSADGSMLATTGDDGDLRVWDPATGAELWSFEGPQGVVWMPSFSPDGSLVAAPYEDEEVVRIWDLTSGGLLHEIGRGDVGFSTSFSPDGRQMAFTTWDSGAIVVDVRSGEQVMRLRHGGALKDLDWSPDGRWIATSNVDGNVRIWDAASGDPRGRLYGHRSEILAADWSPDSSRLVTGSSDGTARVWEIFPDGGRELLSLSAQEESGGLWPVFSADGERVMTGGGTTGTVRIWDVTLSGDAEWTNVATDDFLPGVAFTSDGDGVISSNGDGSVTVWDAANGQGVRAIGRSGGEVGPAANPDPWLPAAAIDVSREGLIAAAGFDAMVWDETTGDEMFVLRSPEGEHFRDVAWSDDGSLLAAARSDGTTTIVDRSGAEVAVIGEEEGFLATAVRFSPDGRFLATARVGARRPDPDASHVTIWDWERGEIVQTMPGWAQDVDFDPSGTWVATGSIFGLGEIWEARSGERIATLSGHTGAISSVEFSPDGSLVATTGTDGTIRVWDPESGTQRQVLQAHDKDVWALAFSPDGSRLASSSPEGIVRIWALDLDDLIEIARRELTRDLTGAECRQYLHLEACPT